LCELLPRHRQPVAILLRILPFRLRGELDLLPVLVQAGEEKDRFAQAASGAGDHIGDDLFVGMAQMGLAIDVINGGSHIKTFAHLRDNVGQAGKLGNWQLGGAGMKCWGQTSRFGLTRFDWVRLGLTGGGNNASDEEGRATRPRNPVAAFGRKPPLSFLCDWNPNSAALCRAPPRLGCGGLGAAVPLGNFCRV